MYTAYELSLKASRSEHASWERWGYRVQMNQLEGIMTRLHAEIPYRFKRLEHSLPQKVGCAFLHFETRDAND